MTGAQRERAFLARALLGLLSALAHGACGEDVAPRSGAAATSVSSAAMPAAEAGEREVVVFAATSLRGAFRTIGDAFEGSHAGVTVTLQLAGTQELRAQVEQGAPADVLACADLRSMETLRAAGHVGEAVVFARNEPVVVVASEARSRITSFAQLPDAQRIVLGAPEVPIGRYTLELLDHALPTLGSDFRARVEARVVSRELNVGQVLAKVSLGEAEAGIVYRTDAARAEPGITTVSIPPEINVIAEYPITTVRGAPHPALARDFVGLVVSTEGQRILREAGFLPPAPTSS